MKQISSAIWIVMLESIAMITEIFLNILENNSIIFIAIWSKNVNFARSTLP